MLGDSLRRLCINDR